MEAIRTRQIKGQRLHLRACYARELEYWQLRRYKTPVVATTGASKFCNSIGNHYGKRSSSTDQVIRPAGQATRPRSVQRRQQASHHDVLQVFQ